MQASEFTYACRFTNPATGESRLVVVSLDQAEIDDASRHLQERGQDGPGGPNGPIARGYALKRACAEAPAGFEPDMQVDRVSSTMH